MTTHDLVDALVITCSMLTKMAASPDAMSVDETAAILRFAKTLTAHAIEQTKDSVPTVEEAVRENAR